MNTKPKSSNSSRWPSIEIRSLGQTGFKIKFNGIVIFIDPYLSNSVQDNESEDLCRLQPIPIQPLDVTDADWVIITHEHRDHCDIDTLLPISEASKNCQFIGPPPVVDILKDGKINKNRILTANYGTPIQLDERWTIHPVPSAHPRIEHISRRGHRWLGYVMKIGTKKIYHAGDTSADENVIKAVKHFGKIDLAFLPLNEKNFFLNQRGIIGNMTIRESFRFAEEINAATVVPTHWDMFELNGAFKDEIKFLYQKLSPAFKLLFKPDTVL